LLNGASLHPLDGSRRKDSEIPNWFIQEEITISNGDALTGLRLRSDREKSLPAPTRDLEASRSTSAMDLYNNISGLTA
jgi:hypothetical protein